MIRYLEIDGKAWSGLEETSVCSPVNHHVGAVSSSSLQFYTLFFFKLEVPLLLDNDYLLNCSVFNLMLLLVSETAFRGNG